MEFTEDIQDVGYGLATHFRMPGEFKVQLYQPKYSKGRNDALRHASST